MTPKFVAPHWNRVVSFALTRTDQFRSPTGPATFGSDQFRQQAQHVVDVSANLTERDKVIAEYWADGPKSELRPGHWNLFAQFISRRDDNGPDQDVKLFLRFDQRDLRRRHRGVGQQGGI